MLQQKNHRLSVHTRLVLWTTAILLVGGTLAILALEWNNPATLGGMTVGKKILAAFFQSGTTRTAGFAAVDQGSLTGSGKLVSMLLMLVGGSPGSTAGGFKTTTLAVMLLGIRAVFRHKERPQCFGRRIADESIRNASAIFLLYLLLFLTGGILICCIDGVPLMAALFEAASAIGTVGLSLGITPELSGASRLILIFLMYFGRVGGLTMIYAVTAKGAPELSQFPQERVTIG